MPTSANEMTDTARSRSSGELVRGPTAALMRAAAKMKLVTPAKRLTGRGAIVGAAILLAGLLYLHGQAQDASVKRNTDILAQLAGVKLIDARWDVAVMRARTDAGASAEPVVQPGDSARIQRALDAAAAQAKSNAMRSAITDVRKAYSEKAGLVTRFQRASADSRQALEAAMRADAAVSTLVRTAWRDFPQRDRLVAAENLVARVLAEAQQYHAAPTAGHREALEAFAADLPLAHSLPPPVVSGLERLESDVHQLLLLKPLEHMLGERLTVLNTASRADEIAETYQRDLNDTLARRERYRIALLLYSAALLILGVWLGVRTWQRYHALEARYAALAADGRRNELAPAGPAEEVMLAAEDSSSDVVDANVRYFRRP
jgi:hypothetical protein